MAARQPDAIALLKADHRMVEELFEAFENSKNDAQKKKLADQICLELSVHTAIEEGVFYPACDGKVEDELLDEALVEHDGAKVLLAEIQDGDPGDEFYDAKVKVLSEMIKHHVKEEEMPGEGLFAQAQKSGIDLASLGEEMAIEKDRLIALYESDGVPTPETETYTTTVFS